MFSDFTKISPEYVSPICKNAEDSRYFSWAPIIMLFYFEFWPNFISFQFSTFFILNFNHILFWIVLYFKFSLILFRNFIVLFIFIVFYFKFGIILIYFIFWLIFL